MESDADSIKACVHSDACHLYCRIVTMTSAKVERQRRYIARINADPQKEFLMRDRLRKKKKVMLTEYETKHGCRKQPEIQGIQLKNKLVLVDPRVLDKPLAIGRYKEIEKPADALSKTLLNTNISRIYRKESISEDGVGDEKAKLYSHALSQYNNNNNNNMLCEMPEEAKVEPKLTDKLVLPSSLPSLNTVVACIREDESIPHDEKVKFYQDALLCYSNLLDGMCEKETMWVNSLGPALPSPTPPSPPPPPSALAESKRYRRRRRESSSSVLAVPAAERRC